jgi:protease-4
MNPSPRQRSTVAFWIIIALLGLGLLISLGLNTGLAVALMAKRGHHHVIKGGQGVDEFPDLTEVWSYGEGEVKAVRIPVTGVIMHGGEETLLGATADMVESILQQIRAARNDESVRAIILEVDSPGGGVTASDEIYAALQAFKASDEKRIITVFIRDLAASGGYYVAVAGDWLVAEPTSVIGSIGVIMQSLNMKGLSEKIGVRDVTIKSGANKDLLNPFEEVSPEQRALLQRMIDAMYERFLGLVQEARPIEAEKLRGLADGRIFVSEEALEHQLIDQIGYWDDVLAKTAELLGETSVRVVRYDQKPDFLNWLSNMRLNLSPSAWLHQNQPRLQYLWQP